MGLFGGDDGNGPKDFVASAREKIDEMNREMDENARETFYSAERAESCVQYVSAGEEIEGVLNISGITHDDDDDSIMGENQGGGVRTSNQVAIFTDERILTRLPGFVKTDTSSIRYENVKSVETKNGMVKRKLTLRTSGEDYHLVAFDSKDVVKVAADFVTEQIRNDSAPAERRSEDSPLEKIEKLKQLCDNGAISKSEFESKKSELLDQI